MVPNAPPRNTPNPLNLLAPVAVVALLYFAREVCIPFILAVLLGFVLRPVVNRLQKWRVPRIPAVCLVVGSLLLILGLCGWMVGGQLVSLAEKLPQYQANVHEKFKSFHTSPGGVIDRFNSTLESYSKEIESIGSNTPSQESTPHADVATTQPLAVAIVKPQTSRVVTLENIMFTTLGPIIQFGIVLILGLFILIRHEDVRDRVIRLLGGGQLHVATQALDDASSRVSRYLLIQLIINASFGACIAIGLYFIGVPYSLLWGLLAACLRFVPFFGAPIAAVAPLMMAFAAMPGWTAVILTIILFAVLEVSIANFVEPWLYGSNTQISPLAIVLSAIFWSWLWGPIGLLLSTPLTVCLVVIGRHVPRLRFLSVLLGDQPVLAPEARFYQRLLAADQAEAWEIAEQKLRDSSLAELYDTIIIPAMMLAEEDRHREDLDETREKYIFQSIRDLLEDLAERPIVDPPVTAPEPAAPDSARAAIASEQEDAAPASPVASPAPPAGKLLKILCIPANDEADELAAIMLSHLLAQRGINMDVISCKTLAAERIEVVQQQAVDLVCVSAVPPQATLHARYMCKRLRARCPAVKIVAGLWHVQGDAEKIDSKLPAALSDGVETSLASAVERIAALATFQAYRSDAPAQPVPASKLRISTAPALAAPAS